MGKYIYLKKYLGGNVYIYLLYIYIFIYTYIFPQVIVF